MKIIADEFHTKRLKIYLDTKQFIAREFTAGKLFDRREIYICNKEIIEMSSIMVFNDWKAIPSCFNKEDTLKISYLYNFIKSKEK